MGSTDFFSDFGSSHPALTPSTSGYGIDWAALQLATQQSQALLDSFFADSTWTEELYRIFGNAGTNPETFSQRVSSITTNVSPADLLGGVTLLSADNMGGALGAFSRIGPNGEFSRIFLNADWASQSTADAITGVLLEEYGHAIDSYLNQELDSPGDEGELFSIELRNIVIPDSEKDRITQEDDLISVSYQGSFWSAEAALTSVSSTSGTNVGINTYGYGDYITFDPITIGTPSGSVLLSINAYDVDYPHEIDSVYILGPGFTGFKFAGYLNGYNNQWTWTTLDISSIATAAGSYTVRIRPDEDKYGNTDNAWVVAARYADITTGTANGYITDLSLSTRGGVTSDITVDTSGNYLLNYYLIDSVGTVRATHNESISLTKDVTFNNGPDTLSGWGGVTNGNYTLRAVLTTSDGSTIRDIDTWSIVKTDVSVSTTPGSDSTPPTVAIVNNDNDLKIGDASTVTFTFSEDIQNFDLNDVTAANGALSGLSSKTNNGNGTYSYTATFTPTNNIADSTNQFVVGTGWSDLAGNAPAATTASANYAIDTQRPTVSISSTDNALKIGDTTVVTFTFNEDVQNFDLTDVTSSPNGTFGTLGAKNNNGDGTYSYSATFTPTDNIEDATNQFVVGTGWSDLAGNAPASTTASANYAIDTLRPTVAITSDKSALHHGQTSLVTFTLSEDSTNFVRSDVAVTGGVLTQWKEVSARIYTAVFMPTKGSATNGSITVANNAFSDAAGNANNDGSDADNALAITVAPTATFMGASASVQPGSLNKVRILLTEGSSNFSQSSIRSSVAMRSFRKISSTLYEIAYVAPRVGKISMSVIAGSYTDSSGVGSIAHSDGLDSLSIDVSSNTSYGSTTPSSNGRGGTLGIVVGRRRALPGIRSSAPVSARRRIPQPVGRGASTGLFRRRR